VRRRADRQPWGFIRTQSAAATGCCAAAIQKEDLPHPQKLLPDRLQDAVYDGRSKTAQAQGLSNYTRNYHARWAESRRKKYLSMCHTETALNRVRSQLPTAMSTAIGERDEPVKAMIGAAYKRGPSEHLAENACRLSSPRAT